MSQSQYPLSVHAAGVTFDPSGLIVVTGTTVQSAIEQLDSATSDLPQGVLAYAEVTAQQPGITTETTLTGLTVSFTVDAGRRIRITGSVAVSSNGAGDWARLHIKEGSTQLQRADAPLPTNGQQHFIERSVIETPPAGPVSYNLAVSRAAGSGTLTMNAAASLPAFILVEDLGAA